MKLISALLIAYHLLVQIPLVFNDIYCNDASHDNCADDPSVFKCRIGSGFVGRADDEIGKCKACVCDEDPYCAVALCDTKKAEKDAKVFYAFVCFNETDVNNRDYCKKEMMKVYSDEVKEHFNCFCHLGPKGESMYNRNLIPKEKAPEDLQHLFSSPTKNNSPSTKTGPLINLFLTLTSINYFFLTAVVFDPLMTDA